MFHLIKLGIYALVGYALYEFAQGLMEESRSGSQGAVEEFHPGRTAVRSAGRR